VTPGSKQMTKDEMSRKPMIVAARSVMEALRRLALGTEAEQVCILFVFLFSFYFYFVFLFGGKLSVTSVSLYLYVTNVLLLSIFCQIKPIEPFPKPDC